jgi:hypothetical protein
MAKTRRCGALRATRYRVIATGSGCNLHYLGVGAIVVADLLGIQGEYRKAQKQGEEALDWCHHGNILGLKRLIRKIRFCIYLHNVVIGNQISIIF